MAVNKENIKLFESIQEKETNKGQQSSQSSQSLALLTGDESIKAYEYSVLVIAGQIKGHCSAVKSC